MKDCRDDLGTTGILILGVGMYYDVYVGIENKTG